MKHLVYLIVLILVLIAAFLVRIIAQSSTPAERVTTFNVDGSGMNDFDYDVYNGLLDSSSSGYDQGVVVTNFSISDFNGEADSQTRTGYFISCSGSDADPGTQDSPWRTISQVNTYSFEPGDTIYFESGCTWDESLTVSSSGSAEGRITYTSFGEGELPTIVQGFSADEKDYITLSDIRFLGRVEMLHSSYGIIDGLTVELTNPGGDAGILVGYRWQHNDPWKGSEEPHHNIIRNNTVSGNGWTGIEISGHDTRRRQYAYEIYNNHTFDNGSGLYVHFSTDGVIYNNHSHNNTVEGYKGEGYGLGIQTGSNLRIYENDFHDNRTSGIECWGGSGGPWGPSFNNQFYRNAFYRNGLNNYGGLGGWDGLFLSRGCNTGTQVYNNLMYDNRNPIRLTPTDYENVSIQFNTMYPEMDLPYLYSLVGVTIQNNIFYQADTATIDERNNFVGDPQFVDVQARDFHLQPTSPAIDAALPVLTVKDDFDENVRPQGSGYDFGAYETEWSRPRPTATPTATRTLTSTPSPSSVFDIFDRRVVG